MLVFQRIFSWCHDYATGRSLVGHLVKGCRCGYG